MREQERIREREICLCATFKSSVFEREEREEENGEGDVWATLVFAVQSKVSGKFTANTTKLSLIGAH